MSAGSESGEFVRVLVVHLDDVRYGMPVDEVDEVLPVAAVVRLPGAPAVVRGVLNLRGELLPVVDLRTRLGLPPRAVRCADHLVVCRVRGRHVAVHVDRAEEIVVLPGDAVRPADQVAASAHLAGVARTPDGLLLVHDLTSFLSADEVLGLDRALETADRS